MINNRLITISLNDNNILIDDSDKPRTIIYNGNSNDGLYKIENLFNWLAEFNINEIKINKEQDIVLLTLQNNLAKVKATINNFSILKKRAYFKLLHSNMITYSKDRTKRIVKKHNIKNMVIAGSLISSVTVIGFIPSINIHLNNKFIYADNVDIEVDNLTEEKNDIEEPIEILNLDDLTITEEPIVMPSNIEIINTKENIENPNIEDSIKDSNLNKENNNDYVDFNEIKNFKDYDDYIRFASNLYFVDYETLKNLVNEYLANPNGNILDLNIHNIDYMKELKEAGFIDGDLNVIYIMHIAKRYASKYTDLNNLPPIKSNKTVEEKEQDLINFATYIYGINNPELILTISKLETGHYTSNLCVEKNNIGGIRSTATFDSFRTFEIGVAELSRVFLYNTCLAIHRDDYDPSMPIQYNMSKSYCTDSPYEWYTTVTSMLNEGTSQATVDKVLNQHEKRY